MAYKMSKFKIVKDGEPDVKNFDELKNEIELEEVDREGAMHQALAELGFKLVEYEGEDYQPMCERIYNIKNFDKFVYEVEQAHFCNEFKDGMFEDKGTGDMIEHYRGRFMYEGPSVQVSNVEERDAIIQVVTVPIQYDQLGRDGFVIYPRR